MSGSSCKHMCCEGCQGRQQGIEPTRDTLMLQRHWLKACSPIAADLPLSVLTAVEAGHDVSPAAWGYTTEGSSPEHTYSFVGQLQGSRLVPCS